MVQLKMKIEYTVHLIKSIAGWGTYLNGLQLNYNEFTKETDMAVVHVKAISKFE